jgi:hypothetical protein
MRNVDFGLRIDEENARSISAGLNSSAESPSRPPRRITDKRLNESLALSP